MKHDGCARNPDRVHWIDFDRAQTFSNPPVRRHQGWFDEEVQMMEYFAKALLGWVVCFRTD